MKRTWLIVGIVVPVFLLLGGAAYVGGRLLNNQNQNAQAAGGSGPVLMTSNGKGGQQQQKVQIQTEPDERLPKTPADVRGLFLRRADSSIFVGTGQVSMTAIKSQDGQISMSASHDGPDVEVVVTHDTTVYKDVTMQQFNGPPPAGQNVKQVLDAGSIDEIGENSTVTVWGDKRGDRVIASVLVYSMPAVFNKGQ